MDFEPEDLDTETGELDWYELPMHLWYVLAGVALDGEMNTPIGRKALDKWWMLLALRFATYIRREEEEARFALASNIPFHEGSRISGYAISTLRNYASENYERARDWSKEDETGPIVTLIESPELAVLIDGEDGIGWPPQLDD